MTEKIVSQENLQCCNSISVNTTDPTFRDDFDPFLLLLLVCCIAQRATENKRKVLRCTDTTERNLVFVTSAMPNKLGLGG